MLQFELARRQACAGDATFGSILHAFHAKPLGAHTLYHTYLLRLLRLLALALLLGVHVCSPLLLFFDSLDLHPNICIVWAAVQR
jgi:hypothetical protein